MKARRGKSGKKEVIDFEMDLAANLCGLQNRLSLRAYAPQAYYHFIIHEPKVRCIHALHYADRVVQHCICEKILAPVFEKRLIYDNAACRKEKGTHFSIYRLSGFMKKHFARHGTNGYFLKYDFKKYFDNIDHEVLKSKLKKLPFDNDTLNLLYLIIDSYETSQGKGLPLGNQSSQWFALYYLDGFDRVIKEKLRIKYYTRYMDDGVLLHESKEYLHICLSEITKYAADKLKLQFNEKTQLFPISNGVNYLGFHFYLTKTGKVVRKVKSASKRNFIKALKHMRRDYETSAVNIDCIQQRLSSYLGHLKHGHTYRLRSKMLKKFMLRRQTINDNVEDNFAVTRLE
jgi:hypothetical protein